MNFNLTRFFEPYVRQWLVNTDSKTEQWVQAVSPGLDYNCLKPYLFDQAIAADKVNIPKRLLF